MTGDIQPAHRRSAGSIERPRARSGAGETSAPYAQLKLAAPFQALLRCPICHAKIEPFDGRIRCTGDACAAVFPIVNGIPVLINEHSSIFPIDSFTQQFDTFFKSFHDQKLGAALRKITPAISKNIKGRQNYETFVRRLLALSDAPKVLVLGGSIAGEGMEALLSRPGIDLVESDVSFGPRTMLISDAHDIPFDDDSFDGLIVQAVLQHVVDPYRCVEEMYRVLKKGGLIYAETPFMQQVHGGKYDFTRFTHLGHRRLFRRFEEVESGAVCGPGMALAWAYQYFLLSFSRSKPIRGLLRLFAGITSFYLTYFDYFLIDKAGALDAASGCYFIGQKSDRVLTDRELIRQYRGAM